MSLRKDREQKIQEKASENRIVRRIVAVVSLVIFIILSGMIAGGALYVNNALKPVDPEDEKVVEVSVPIGSSSTDIAQLLEEKGLIKSARVFRYYVKYKNETGFQAGDYELSTAMDIKEIISELKEGKVIKEAALKITVPEGLRIVDIADIIAEETSHTAEDIVRTLQDESFIHTVIDTYPIIDKDAILQDGMKYPLEGYLYPATYEFEEENPSIESILLKMIEEMQTIVQKYETEIPEPYTVHQILTLASMIETEAKSSEDRFKISGVFYNRLANDMRLDSDPTVKYALDKDEIQVTYADTDVDSPYNTYRMKGFPIGPIASPREESIEAAVFPEEMEAFYFFARPNGEVIYTNTYGEHQAVIAKYRHEWNELIEEQQESGT